MGQPNLLVNLQGKRVMNEDHMQNATYLSNVVSHQKGRVCISIVDSSIAKYYMRNGVDNVSMVRPNPDVSDFADAIKMAKRTEMKVCISQTALKNLQRRLVSM